MSSTAIVASFRASVVVISAAAFIGFSPVGARADSTQGQPAAVAEPVAVAEPQGGSSLTPLGASTILKLPATALQPLPGTPLPQPPASAAAPPLPASASPALPDAIPHPAAAGPTGTLMGTVVSATSANSAASTESAVPSQVGAIDQLFPANPAQRRSYEHAASAFAAFCHDWEQLLHDREVNNLQHLSWREQSGLETATYTGYGKVESCECKASKEGLPIGKIRYEEMNYSLAGKTIDQAEHAAPKLVGVVNTLEIFSWEKNKWFY